MLGYTWVVKVCVDGLGSIGRYLLRNDAGSMAAPEEQRSRAGAPRRVLRVVQGASREHTRELARVTLILAAPQLLLPSPLLACCLPRAVSIGTKPVFLC